MADVIKKKKTKMDFVQKVVDASGREYEDVEREMAELKELKDITYGEYFREKLWLKTRTQQHIAAKFIIRKREKRAGNFELIAKELGITKKEVKAKLKAVNEKGIYKMTLVMYTNFEVYRYKEEELDEVLKLFARRTVLRRSLQSKLKAIDRNELTYGDLTEELEEMYDIFRKLMPESLYKKYEDAILISRPDLAEKPEMLREVAVDMAVTRFWMDFNISEYVSFHFVGKTVEEKHQFITDKERMQVIRSINDPAHFDEVDDKFRAYSRLKDYYRREAIFVSSPEDFPIFDGFCEGKTVGVVKPYCDSMGRGIKPLALNGDVTPKAQFDELLAEYGSFIMEEKIQAHPKILALNPDSVNTVRVITYFDGKKVIIHDTFMKVGKKGSFVDNGGAGGIFVSVNRRTGRFKSDGCDENGVIYSHHPDTGIRFKGYKLPDWRQAKKLAKKLAPQVPGLSYIGWDFTYTADKKWIIVEGNSKTQFFGQQCTTGVGKRKDFMETVHYKPAVEELLPEEEKDQSAAQAEAAAQAEE